MRSLIILEVEHDDTTDPLTGFMDDLCDYFHQRYAAQAEAEAPRDLVFKDSTVRVDIPECFRLDN
jgi:hypothetical protein